MARITTRDGERVVPNRYEPVLLAAELARELPSLLAREPDPEILGINLCRRIRDIPLLGERNDNQRVISTSGRRGASRVRRVMIARLKAGLTIANLLSAAAALLLTASPWLAGFTRDAIAAGNAVLCGLLILSFTLAALLQLRDWRSWMSLTPGVWVLLSPWILGFAAHVAATAVHIIVGLVVSILAMIELGNTETLCLED